ncbi:MAG: SDR family oxidoreductase [Kofleriaceae bacterium]
MSMSLAGKRVVLVGGASGIGAAIGALAAELGAEVIVGSRRDGSLDVRDEASVEAFFTKVGAFDHLAITAGDWDAPMRGQSIGTLDLATIKKSLDVRFWGAIACVKHASHHIAKSGSITLTSGMLVHRPMKGMPVAAAMGGATELLAKGLAVDLAPIRVNAVCPGLVLTEIVQQMPEAYRNAAVANQPLPRTATPAEAAQAYVYSMVASYVTGQVLPVDGGGLLV